MTSSMPPIAMPCEHHRVCLRRGLNHLQGCSQPSPTRRLQRPRIRLQPAWRPILTPIHRPCRRLHLLANVRTLRPFVRALHYASNRRHKSSRGSAWHTVAVIRRARRQRAGLRATCRSSAHARSARFVDYSYRSFYSLVLL